MTLRSSSWVLLLFFFPISLVFGGGQVELSVKEFSLTDAAACISTDRCAIDLQFCIGTTDASCGLIDKRARLDSVAQLLAQRVLTANFTGRWNEAVIVTVDIHNASSQQLVMMSRTFVALSPTENRLKSITTHSFGNRIVFQVRVTCNEGFFGADCASYCPPPGPRDNFVCTPKGRQCLAGWNGTDCKEPVCESGCEHGKCIAPNSCSCFPGWTGATCAECIPYNGCKNGYCTRPGTCVCRPNWTGRFCDKVVDKCAENPCANGGICTSVEHDTFRCICPDGFAGETCSEKVSPCATQPCGSNGVCINTGPSRDDYVCQCHDGFAGRNCERLQAAASNEPSVKMNITVNDITVTVHENSPSAAIEQKLELLTVLITICIVLIVMVAIAVCAAGKYLQSLKAWLRRNATSACSDAQEDVEEGETLSQLVVGKRPFSKSDSAVTNEGQLNNSMAPETSMAFHLSVYVPSPPPPYESCIGVADA